MFFRNIDPSRYTLYGHAKSNCPPGWVNDIQIPQRLPTQWGDISLVRATLLLYEEALKDSRNCYFILLSESCIPIISFCELSSRLEQELLSGEKSFLAYRHIEDSKDRSSRYGKLSARIRTKLPWSDFYSQHQWMILNRRHVEALVQHESTADFARVHAVDEHYAVTCLHLLGHLHKECISHKTTYCDWGDKKASHPRHFDKITPSLVRVARKRGCFFLRKVTPDCVYSEFLVRCVLSLTNRKSDV